MGIQLPDKSRKHCGKRRNCSCDFFFSLNVFKSCLLLMHQNEYLWSEGLIKNIILKKQNVPWSALDLYNFSSQRSVNSVTMAIINPCSCLLLVLGFNATLTPTVILWQSVMHICFLAFSHQY